MGYVAKKVRERPDGTIYWQIVFEDRRKDRPVNVSRETPIHQDDLKNIGINRDDSFERAKEVCSQLNAKSRLEKAAERSKVRAMARKNKDYLVDSAFLPKSDVQEFEDRILFKRLAGEEDSRRFRRLLSHWKYTQKLIAALQIEPKDYADEAIQIFRYFERKKTSPAYVVKILRILNAWGQFCTKRHGGTGIEEVKLPRGKQRQDIARAYRTKEDYKGQSDPLTPDKLRTKESKLLPQNFNWLYLSVWLGLRPEEVDNLKDENTWRLELNDDGKTQELWVFQPKLVSVPVEKAWKPIPLWHKNQQRCLEIIEKRDFKRPLNKVLGKVFTDERITGYSGRKGFTDLMLSFNQDLEQIAVWLGHTTIETTWKFYKQKQVVRFNKKAA